MSTIIPTLSEELKLLVEKINTLQGLYQNAQRKIIKLQEDQVENDKQVDATIEIQEHSDRLQELINKGDEQINNLMNEKNTLQQERDEAQQLSEGQQSVIQFLNQDIDQLRKELEEKNETIDVFNQQKRASIMEIQKLKMEIRDYIPQIASLEEIQGQNKQLLKEQEVYKTEIELLNHQIKKLSKR